MSAQNVSRDPWATGGSAPLYLPYLIASLVASAGIVIGSLGPWMTFLVFDRSNIDGDGKYTMVAGIIATVAMFVVATLGRSRPAKTEAMARLCRVPIVAGVLSFVVGAIDAHEVLSRHVEVFGATLGPQIGWGLWLVLVMSVVLVVTASVLVRQIHKLADDDELVASWRDNPVPPMPTPWQPVEETVEETTRVRCVGCAHVQSVPVRLRSFECEQCGKQLRRKAPAQEGMAS
jgi:hypothetical protein